INGAMSHALDFDDVHRRMHGHPTVAIAPAVLALAEATGASGDRVLAAFVAGLEVAGALGAMMDDAHYEHGFHATATVGTVAAAAGCAQLMGLDAERAGWALSLAGTQAAGLKANFGTMAKPLHAGRAASNGLLAARLAARGFTARPDGLECEQGFGPTLSSAFSPAPFRPDPAAAFEVESVLFKYHAACYLTHSTVEALASLRAETGIGADDLDRLVLHVPVTHTRVCDIRDPRSGLDVKFSIRSLAGLALMGADTAALDLYTDATARDPKVAALRERVEIDPRPLGDGPRHGAAITLTTRDGRTLRAEANVGVPASDLLAQQGKLEAKARAIATPAIGEARAEAMIAAAAGLDAAPDLTALLDAIC
ncbi:MAG: MmgE/PrpD family protein, partial [Pseudomonadota bacterium]|nr:MmgE/PrpD family protein [Pseudomonadota bacterium]